MGGVSSTSPSGSPGKPPRSALSVRDMVGAVAVLVAVVLLFAGMTRSCSFAPGGPTVDSASGPRVDAPAQLRVLAGSTPFPLRVPMLPVGWQATTVDTERIGGNGARAVRTGYLTPEGHYLRLVQSDAEEPAMLATEAQGTPVAAGPIVVAGTTWVSYTDDTPEPIRVAALDGVRLLVTGSGTDDEFRTLAAATTGGEILP
jgi:uncharacterized protein DUF4245